MSVLSSCKALVIKIITPNRWMLANKQETMTHPAYLARHF